MIPLDKLLNHDWSKQSTIDLYSFDRKMMYSQDQKGNQSVSKFQLIKVPGVDDRIPPKGFKVSYVLNNDQWHRWVRDKYGRAVHYERFDGYWFKMKYNDDGSIASFQNSNGVVR